LHLALFDHNEMLHVMRVDSPDVIRVSCPVGTRDPLHCTALGKAFLASLPDDLLAAADRGMRDAGYGGMAVRRPVRSRV